MQIGQHMAGQSSGGDTGTAGGATGSSEGGQTHDADVKDDTKK
jgi:hypothetical protein